MYVNSLIGLEENMPTYGIDGKKVNGHVTISTPGIIKCYVQNLNPKDGKEFVLYGFSSKEDKGVRIGTLASPKESRETKWRIDEYNVMNSSIKAKDIDAVAVVKEGSGMRNTDTVLVGFARNKYRISNLLQDLLPEDEIPNNDMTTNGANQPIMQGPMTPIQGAGAPTEVPVTPVPGSGISLFGPITPVQGAGAPTEVPVTPVPGSGISLFGPITPVQGVGAPMPGSTALMQGPTAPMPGSTAPMQGPTAPMQGSTALMQGIEQVDEMEETEGLEGAEEFEEDESIYQCQIERVLQETYTKQQDYKAIFDELNRESRLLGSKLKEEENQIADYQVQRETPEEISYLEEIEKKLKDIQARLKVSDTLEQSIKKFRSVEFSNRPEDVGKISDGYIEDIRNKVIEFEDSLHENKESIEHVKSDDGLQRIYHNAPKVQPFEYRSDQVDWVKIGLSDLSTISVLPQQWCTQPFVTFSYYKYNDIILGKEKGLEKYYVGIPDIYHPERKNILESDIKVETFLCRKNITPEIGEYGYWVVSL